jgi:hypothetical protein
MQALPFLQKQNKIKSVKLLVEHLESQAHALAPATNTTTPLPTTMHLTSSVSDDMREILS